MSGDCPTGDLVDLESSRENNIQFRRSDILSLDGSSFLSPLTLSRTSFHECTNRDISYEESELLENEKFDFDMPSDIMEDMSPEKCQKRNSSTREFSEITVRPPILSPPVFDPLEEIFQEARKIARRLSLSHNESSVMEDNLSECNGNNEKPLTNSTSEKSSRECESKKFTDEAEFETSPRVTSHKGIASNVSIAKIQKPLKMNCETPKDTSRFIEPNTRTPELSVRLNANVRNVENVENDSRVANCSEKLITVPGSHKKTKEVAKRAQDFKKPLLGKERLQRTADVNQITPKKGKPVFRSATLKEKSVTKVKSPAKNNSPSGKITLFRRRSIALTKQELKVAEANERPRNMSGSPTSSTPGKVPEPIFKGASRPTLPRPVALTPARMPTSKVGFTSETKHTPVKESEGKTNADKKSSLQFSQRLFSKIAMPKKNAMPTDANSCVTPSKIRAPSTLIATPKSAAKESVLSTTPLRIVPKFNCKM